MFENFREVFQTFLVTLLSGLLTVLAGFLIALAKKGFEWLGAKIASVKSETARTELNKATTILQDVVVNTVTSLQQTLGDEIKRSLEEGDGKYTREDLLGLKDEAFNIVVGQLNEGVIKILEETFDDVDQIVSDMIETQVRALKEKAVETITLGPITGVVDEDASKRTLLE